MRKTAQFVILIGTFIVGLCSVDRVQAQTSSVRFYLDMYDTAFEIAKRENKLIFVDTYAKWCIPCKKMNRVFSDRKVAGYFNEHFVNVKVNMDEKFGKLYQTKYDIFFLPTLLILDTDGNVMFRSDNKIFSAEELVATVDEVLNPQYYPETIVANVYEAAPPVVVEPTRVPEAKPKTKKSGKAKKSQIVTKSKTTGATILVDAPTITDTDYSDDPNEKILLTVDPKQTANLENMPPEMLRELAYFKVRLMDGSQIKVVNSYLKSQPDWSTEDNVRFIFDFLFSTDTPQFKYMVNNRDVFDRAIGKDKVDQSIEILVNQKLVNGYPRPNLSETKELLAMINPDLEDKELFEYYLSNKIAEGNLDEFDRASDIYLSTTRQSDMNLLGQMLDIVLKNGENDGDWNKGLEIVNRMLKSNALDKDAMMGKIELYLNKGKIGKAEKTKMQLLTNEQIELKDEDRFKLAEMFANVHLKGIEN